MLPVPATEAAAVLTTRELPFKVILPLALAVTLALMVTTLLGLLLLAAPAVSVMFAAPAATAPLTVRLLVVVLTTMSPPFVVMPATVSTALMTSVPALWNVND